MRSKAGNRTSEERVQLLLMALPSLVSMLASSLCSLLDALLLARHGTQTAAAVSLGFPVLSMIQTIGFTFGMGAGSHVSRSLGAKRKEDALVIASTAFFSALAVSFLLCCVGFFAARPLSRLLGADDALVSGTAAYMRFLLASGPLLCMNLVLSSLLRARGDTASGMIAFLSGACVCLPLQLLLITHLSLGVTGSGAAMLARESVTLSFLVFFLFRRGKDVRPRSGLIRPCKKVYADIMRSGLPTLLRQGLASLSSVLLSSICAGFGPAVAAGMGLCVRFTALISSGVIGFGQGFQPVFGMAFGAGDMERICRAYRFCIAVVVCSLLLLGIPLFFFAPQLLQPFSPDPQTTVFAEKALRVQSIVFFAQGAVIMMNMLLQSMGLAFRASLIATSRQGWMLIPLLLVLPRLFGETGLLLAQSVSDLLSLGVCYFLTRDCLPPSCVTRSSCGPCGCSDARTASP